MADGAVGPGAPAVPFDDPRDAGQADAGAGELGGVVQPLERLEQLARISGIEAGPVIPHVAADRAVLAGRAGELDDRVIAVGGELPGVFEQVLQHGADQAAVRHHPDAVLDGEAHRAAGALGLKLTGDDRGLGAQIDRLPVHAGPRDPRQEQQVIDERGHPLTRRLDAAGVAAAGLIQPVTVVLHQRITETAQRPQRGPQVMGDRIGERLQILVHPLQFGRPPRDPDLEFGVQRPHLRLGIAEVGKDVDARLEGRLGGVTISGRVLQDVRQRALRIPELPLPPAKSSRMFTSALCASLSSCSRVSTPGGIASCCSPGTVGTGTARPAITYSRTTRAGLRSLS